MPTLLFSLRGVPDDEANEIRALLTEHDIHYYETSAGNWGISMPALWLSDKDRDEMDTAQQLLDAYHHHRAITQRENYIQLKKEGKNKSLIDVILEQPFKCLIYLAAIVFIGYLYFRMLAEFGL